MFPDSAFCPKTSAVIPPLCIEKKKNKKNTHTHKIGWDPQNYSANSVEGSAQPSCMPQL